MKKKVYVNQKGGSGKSILSYNDAYYLAEQGKRVLFIDGDEQANSSKSLAQFAVPGIGASALFSESPINLPTLPQQIVLLRGDAGLRQVEKSDKGDDELVTTLRARLAEIADGFDYAVIDTAGANSRVANALVVASDYAVLPCRIDPYSIDVATEVLKRIMFIQKKWNPGLVNLGILPNEYDTNSPAQDEWLKQLMSAYKQFVLGAFVTKRSAYREACGEGVPVWRLESESEDDAGKGKVKTAARTAGREVKAVFKMMQDKMENT
ncbi:Sporulation initiation inhibitor protein Soj [Paraburkholderia aspalathi]|uniref:ParA family protein n=1 Tax=Paraburkholderia aspalathi TaxID=1324617 RepID=UPI001B09DA5E|nr:ParA family protein [Paraburkholderia aspalathi]CAE6850875.1 Sporulation initiation inhibitor protein Soj [Paraburkholderia aspalathi]